MRICAKCVLILVVLLFLLIFIPSETIYYERDTEHPQNSSEDVTTTLRPELVPICSCESMQGKYGTPTHYEEDGVTVLRGRVNPDDIGICQINLYYHEDTAKEMGLDLFVEEDNITFANHLYGLNGNQDWSWSRGCWE